MRFSFFTAKREDKDGWMDAKGTVQAQAFAELVNCLATNRPCLGRFAFIPFFLVLLSLHFHNHLPNQQQHYELAQTGATLAKADAILQPCHLPSFLRHRLRDRVTEYH